MDANIVSLSGIAIAVGTIVDMGIVICENILRHLEEDPPDMPRAEVIHRAASEVGSAIVSAIASTIISFIPGVLHDRARKASCSSRWRSRRPLPSSPRSSSR